MFAFCDLFNQPLNGWDVSNVTSMYQMFGSCDLFNQPLDNWNISNVNYISGMFIEAPSFDQDLSQWDFSNLQSSPSSIIYNSGLSTLNYDNILLGFANSNLQNQTLITGTSGNMKYCNFNVRDYLVNNMGWSISGDQQSQNCNQILGNIYYDFNSNGCTNTDLEALDLIIQAVDDNNYSISTIIQNNNYFISLYEGSHNISLINLPPYFTASPLSQTVDFSTTSTEQVDFCLTANQTVNDLNITLLPLNGARPGFSSFYKLVVSNVGTESIDNVIATLNFDDTMQSFTSALPIATNTTANSLEFNLGTIVPFGSAEVQIEMLAFTPPTVNADDILNFTATVLPNTADYTVEDNTFNYNQIVVNAYDPNDKRVLQGDEITLNEADEYLDYIIRFQNTGSANATFVRIIENLDEELDWSTLKIISSSHDYSVKIDNGNEVEYLFDNINLPYQAIDDAGSNGYIAYKIKPKTTVQLGDVMSGDANIYFDYNLPIITNIASTTIINNLSVTDFSKENLITIYPNPTEHGVYIKTKSGVIVKAIQLYNIQGKELMSINENVEFLDTRNISKGMYLIKIKTNSGEAIKKLIIK